MSPKGSPDLRPGDRQALLELFYRSSPETRRERFHGSLSLFPQRYLDDILTGAHGQLALVARDTCHPQNYGKAFGLASAAPVGPSTAEFAVWVDDAWQGHGVGALLVRAILNLLAQQGISIAVGIMESGNGAIRRLIGRVAPQATTRFEDGMVVVSVPLAEWAATAWARTRRRRPAPAVALPLPVGGTVGEHRAGASPGPVAAAGSAAAGAP
jgi:GNAT superfamily N-acetyltransferase